MHLPLELLRVTGRSRTDAFDMKNSKSQLKQKFEFLKVDVLGIKPMKTQNKFKKWIVNNEYHAAYDFKEMTSSTFKCR